MVAVLAVAAAVLYLIAFVLHWTGKGSAPLDSTGVFLLGMICLAVHLALHFPFGVRRPPA